MGVKSAMARRLFATLIAVFAVAIGGCAHQGAQSAASATADARGVVFGNVARGADVFRANCAVCHIATGAAGGVGPSLEHEKQRKNYEQTLAWIMQPDPPMPKLYPASLSEKDVDDVAAYVQSL
jgi:mono/diheme cytochrome c family protein